MDAVSEVDVRALLPHVNVRAPVMHRTDDRIIPIAAGRFLAEQLPHATMLELPGEDHMVFVDSAQVVDAVHAFMREGPRPEPESWIGTLLHAHGSGSLLDEEKRRILESDAAQRVHLLPDGWVAVFDSPQRALRAAERLRALGRGRVGALSLHAGACDRMTDLPAPSALEALLALAEGAAPLEVRVSRTLRDIVPDPDHRFESVAEHGSAPRHWRLRA